MPLYPLRFEPLLRRYIWGGRRLATLLGKSLPAGEDFAESWELVDHQETQSVVRFGPLQGLSLSELCQRFGEKLLGSGNDSDGFPLLFKFIDAQQDLSVQRLLDYSQYTIHLVLGMHEKIVSPMEVLLHLVLVEI